MKLFGIKPSVKSTPILAFHPAITNILICSKDFFGVDFVLEPGAASTSEQEQKNTFKWGIYLTPPTPRCSVLGCERGLPEDIARVGTALQPRGGLRRVSRSSALAGRMGLSTLRRSRGLADSAESLALRAVPV